MPRRVRGPTARDVILTSEAAAALTELEESQDPRQASIARRVRALRPALQANALHGEPIKKAVLQQRSAAQLLRRHGLANCFCVDLPDGWRLLYTVVRHEQLVHVVVVEIVDHANVRQVVPGQGNLTFGHGATGPRSSPQSFISVKAWVKSYCSRSARAARTPSS